MKAPFNSHILRDWFTNQFEISDLGLDSAVTMGSGPFDEAEFDEFLKRNKIRPYDPSEEVETIVVGINNWDQSKLQQMMDLRKGKTLRVYSQEMFFSFLITGADPYLADRNVLTEFTKGHPAFEFLSTMWFDWPTTHISPGYTEHVGTRPDWEEIGLLGALDYRVGKNGLPISNRHEILSRAFEGELPDGLSTYYKKECGDPSTPERLKKIANIIAGLCRIAKRRKSHRMDEAIKHWEADLEWLKQKFYKPMRLRFLWPQTEE